MSCDWWKSYPGTTKIIQSQAYAGLLVTNTQRLAAVCFRQTTSHPGSNRSPGKSICETFSSACTFIQVCRNPRNSPCAFPWRSSPKKQKTKKKKTCWWSVFWGSHIVGKSCFQHWLCCYTVRSKPPTPSSIPTKIFPIPTNSTVFRSMDMPGRTSINQTVTHQWLKTDVQANSWTYFMSEEEWKTIKMNEKGRLKPARKNSGSWQSMQSYILTHPRLTVEYLTALHYSQRELWFLCPWWCPLQAFSYNYKRKCNHNNIFFHALFHKPDHIAHHMKMFCFVFKLKGKNNYT